MSGVTVTAILCLANLTTMTDGGEGDPVEERSRDAESSGSDVELDDVLSLVE